MMCTPEVGLKSIFMGCFMIEYDKFDFKIKVFKNIKMVKKQNKNKTLKACLLKIIEDKPLKYYTKLYFLWFSINF